MSKISRQEAERDQAVQRLTEELEAGRISGEENGWISLEEAEERLGLNRNKIHLSAERE